MRRKLLKYSTLFITSAILTGVLLVVSAGQTNKVLRLLKGGGQPDGETYFVSRNGDPRNYTAGVRTAVAKMIVRGGVKLEHIRFDPPSAFKKLQNPSVSVFHPDGGGYYRKRNFAEYMQSGASEDIYFNMNFEIVGVGESLVGTHEGNEIIAFLPGVTHEVCTNINNEAGLPEIVKINKDLSGFYKQNLVESSVLPKVEVILGGVDSPSLENQPFGCFKNGDGTNVYYHVIVQQ